MQFLGSFGNQLLFSVLLLLGLHANYARSSVVGLEASLSPKPPRPPSPAKQNQNSTLSGEQRNYTLHSTYGSAYEVAKRCSQGDQNPGVLVPLPLVSWVLQDILSANRSAINKDLLDIIGNFNNLSMWVLDPWGGCRSATVFTNSTGTGSDRIALKQESCSSKKMAICMSYDVAENDTYASLALTVYNRYWTPNAPALPPAVPGNFRTLTAVPAGFRLIDGMVLGHEPDSIGSKPFSGSEDFAKYGPVVNLVTRWKPEGLSELACVYGGEEFDEDEELLGLELGLVGFPLIREDSFQNELRTSYIVRVEGCVGLNTIQRLAVTTAIGASYTLGTRQCTANFLEEAPPGGYLAYLRWTRGSELDATMATSSRPSLFAASPPPAPFTNVASPRVRRLQMVWAVPLNSTSGALPNTGANALRQVFPRLEPVVPVPESDCSEARTILPANLSISTDIDTRTPCGSSYACPSYMCCVLHPNDSQAKCVTTPALCSYKSCNPSYGLCEQGPWPHAYFMAHEGVFGATTLVSPLPPPSPSVSAAFTNPTTVGPDIRNGTLSVDTVPVRNATVVYAAMRAEGGMHYQEATDQCSALDYLGLTWRIIDITDALAFENSLLLSEEFLNSLNGEFRWVWLSWRGTGTCIRAHWKVWDGQVQLSDLVPSKCASESAAVICRATWPGLTGYTADVSAGQLAAPSSGSDGSRRTAVRFTPGSHALSVSNVGDKIGLSGASCKATSVCSLNPDEELAEALSDNLWKLSPASSAVPLQVLPLELNSPLSAIALRPLTAWSTVDGDMLTYDTIAALAIQYYSPILPNTSLPDATVPYTINAYNQTLAPLEPVFLGSVDGTTEEENDSEDDSGWRRGVSEYLPYEGAWRKRTLLSDSPDTDDYDWGLALADHVSYDAGWRTLSLDVSGGEVVVEVSGCRGGLVEQLVLRTSAGRLLSSPAGPGFMCSVPFRLTAPEGGYLVAMQALAGSYLEELQVVWGTPVRLTPPAAELRDSPAPASARSPLPSPDPPADASDIEPPPARFLSPGMSASQSPSPAPIPEENQPSVIDDAGSSEGEVAPPSKPREPKYMSPLPTQQRPADGGAASSTSSKLGVGAGVGVGLGVSAVVVVTVWMAVWVAKRRGLCGGGGGGRGGGGARNEAAGVGGAGRRRGSGGDGGGRGRDNWHMFSALPMSRQTSSGGGGEGRGSGEDGGGAVALSAVVVDPAKPPPGMSPGARKGAPAFSITPSLGDSTESSGLGAGPSLPRCSPERTSRPRGPIPQPDTNGAFAAPGRTAAMGGVGAEAAAEAAAKAAAAKGAAAEGALAGEPSPLGSELLAGPGFGRPATGDSLEQQMHAALFQKALYVARPYIGWEGAGGKPGDPSPDPYSVLGAGAATGTSTSTTNGTALSAGPTTLGSAPPRPGVGRLSGGASIGATASTAAGATVGSDAVIEEGGVGKQSQRQQSQGQQQQQEHLLRARANAAAVSVSDTAGGGASYAAGDGGDGVSEAVASGGEGGGGGAGALSMPTHGSLGQLGGSGAAGGGSAAELLLGRDVIVNVDDPATYLGHGTSGVVRRGALRQPDGSWRPVAVKLLNTPPGETAADGYNRHLRTLVQEVTILGSLCHPNIVQLLGGCLNPGASFLVEELCGGTLSHAIYDASSSYNLSQLLRWSADIAAGLAFLHPHIMHRDLKPSNVLLDEAGTAKISDFGLARFKAHTTLHTKDAEVGTTCYMAPECFVSTDVKVTAACDVYSLGVLINEMATRARPWNGTRTAVVGFKVAVVGERPELAHADSALCPPALRQLVKDCWAQQPSDRPTSAQVLARLQDLLRQVEAGAGPVGAERQGQEPNQGAPRSREGEEANGEAGEAEQPSREREGPQRQATRSSQSGAGAAERLGGTGTGVKDWGGSQELEGSGGTDWPESSPTGPEAATGVEERSDGGR